jgi:hypothetical protein
MLLEHLPVTFVILLDKLDIVGLAELDVFLGLSFESKFLDSLSGIVLINENCSSNR